MKLILCLDERNGLSFNNRRQSRDRAVIDKIVCLAKEEPVWITSYSSELFRETHCNVRVSADIMHAAKPGEYLFIENQDPHELLAQVSSVYIFRWKPSLFRRQSKKLSSLKRSKKRSVFSFGILLCGVKRCN